MASLYENIQLSTLASDAMIIFANSTFAYARILPFRTSRPRHFPHRYFRRNIRWAGFICVRYARSLMKLVCFQPATLKCALAYHSSGANAALNTGLLKITLSAPQRVKLQKARTLPSHGRWRARTLPQTVYWYNYYIFLRGDVLMQCQNYHIPDTACVRQCT